MEWVETTGRSVAEALDAALDELGVDDDEVEYEVVEEPKSGLFGKRDARIRARVKPVSREKPGDRRRRGARREGGRRDSGGGVAVAANRDGESDGGTGERPRRRSRGGRGRRGGGGGQGRGRGSEGQRESTKGNSTVDEDIIEVPLEEQAAAAEEFTRGIVEPFELGATVKAKIEDEGVLVDVTGGELGLLVGPKGATLQAIEELVRTAVQRHTEGHGARINVDVAGYRAKRREALARFAADLGEKVKESGKEQALEPMNASDRKVVHDAIAELEGVTTISEGEEPRRRVVLRLG
jgi:spoIIIJ-associated protein